MTHIATLQSQAGTSTLIQFDPGKLEPLAMNGQVDAYIVATEDGFSPLGINRAFIADDLGITESEIGELANWNRFKNPRVTLVAIPTRRKHSLLRGVVLACSETSECYKRFATPFYGRPYRDFYYNVTYEAIAYAAIEWAARRPGISHLSASGQFTEDIATCNAEALAHYCDSHPGSIDSFTFFGCCMGEGHFTGIKRLNPEGESGRHRPIVSEIEQLETHSLIHLNWSIGLEPG
jgi:hypothetical protein